MNNGGVNYTDLVIGSGEPVSGKVWVHLRARMFLNHGEELPNFGGGQGIRFRLDDREIFAGLRYAVEGMRVGGTRKVKIPPHLAYRDQGVPGIIPPNAMMRGEIELLAFGLPGETIPLPVEALRGEALSILGRGEESSPLPRWSLWITSGDYAQPFRSALDLEWSTRDDGKWGGRSAYRRQVDLALTPPEIEAVLVGARQLPGDCPTECLGSTDVGSQGGESPPLAWDGDVCTSVSFVRNGTWEPGFYLRVDSPVWEETAWGRKIREMVEPYLVPLVQARISP